MLDRIVAMARGAPVQQVELAELALATLEEWVHLAKPNIPTDEAQEYVNASQVAIRSLEGLRRTMVGKPTSLAERDTNDPDEIETWRLYGLASGPVCQLGECLVGYTKEAKRRLLEMVEEFERQRAAERALEAKSGFWSKLKFWQSGLYSLI